MPVLDVPDYVLRQAFDLVVAQWPVEIRPGSKSFHINGGCNMRELAHSDGVPIESDKGLRTVPEE